MNLFYRNNQIERIFAEGNGMNVAQTIYTIQAIIVMGIFTVTHMHGPGGGGESFVLTLGVSIFDLAIAVLLRITKAIMRATKDDQFPVLSPAIAAFNLSATVCFLISWPMCFTGGGIFKRLRVDAGQDTGVIPAACWASRYAGRGKNGGRRFRSTEYTPWR